MDDRRWRHVLAGSVTALSRRTTPSSTSRPSAAEVVIVVVAIAVLAELVR
jgi:hypothetical protein